jgi:hypothetical protein
MRAVRDVCGLVGCGDRKTTRSTIIIIEQLQQQASSQGEGESESKNHQNGEKMPQTLMSTLVDCYFVYV